MEPRNHRKTRVVCVSDTHAYTPSEAGFRLPAGDVLIHAGDLTNQGSLAELRRTIAWIAKTPYEVKIIIAGVYPPCLPRLPRLPLSTTGTNKQGTMTPGWTQQQQQQKPHSNAWKQLGTVTILRWSTSATNLLESG